MVINIERDGDSCVVVLDMLDGNTLRSKKMSEAECRVLKDELERRIFEIQKGARAGMRDRM
jgi:hypothetical protein